MDETLTCQDCGVQFPFTAGEQEFYASKQLTQPKRCKPCRVKKKAAMFDRQKQQQRNTGAMNGDDLGM